MIHAIRAIRTPAVAVAVAVILVASPHAIATEADALAEANAAYARGDYLRAAAVYDELDRAGQAGGVVLYKLYFCQRSMGDPGADGTLQRAVERLAAEAPESKSLETHFYLVNAYSSSGRGSEAQEAARLATDGLESGAVAEPGNWEAMFRAGKLYSDRQAPEQAIAWYTRSLDAHGSLETPPPSPYIPWARRYIVDRSLESGDLATAEDQLGRLVSDEPNGEDLDRLAVLRVRLGHYGGAVEAWRQAERLNPADANRARYCWRLAQFADGLETLPAAAPDGRSWGDLSREELEAMLAEQAGVVGKSIQAGIESHPMAEPLRAELQQQVDAAQPVFVAAGLEYAVRGLPIRQTAFFGGYAPLIFNPGDWNVKSSVQRRVTSGR